eukprot:TRINITY_DN20067_c0_g2_i1.p1 TRINITY_DN20067_c0_g2~~TRINITY_DN20067_c0_g2_i1.p1  ORF type:complete len:325 (+),score=90.79 TRINITY_DN20067_c0_g2_i1:115-1089(+)
MGRRKSHLEPVRGSHVKNQCYAGLMTFVTFLAVILLLVCLFHKGSWFTMKPGLRFSAGALLPGNNLMSGVYDVLDACYFIAEDSVDIAGFMWYYDTASPQAGRVQCDFKRTGTPWITAQAGQTAVVKAESTWGCGLLQCNGVRESTPSELYDCSALESVANAAQAFGVIGFLFCILVFLLSLTLTCSCFVKVTLWTAPHLWKLHALVLGCLTLTWILLVVGFAAEFCGRRLKRDANLGFALPILLLCSALIGPNIVLAPKALGPLDFVDPHLHRREQQRKANEEELRDAAEAGATADRQGAGTQRRGQTTRKEPAPGPPANAHG